MFLWVIREKENVAEYEKLSCREELEKLGMIVPWCSQAEILSNSSFACFVTHCGWNSSLESLASGVPLVVFPQKVGPIYKREDDNRCLEDRSESEGQQRWCSRR